VWNEKNQTNSAMLSTAKTTPIERQLQEICRQYQVDILYAFGSRAKEALAFLHGEIKMLHDGRSDLDIGAKPNSAASWGVWDKVGLAQDLEDLFRIHRVDLVSLADAGPYLAAEIIAGERLFADDSYLADEYDLYIMRRIADHEFLEKERLRHVLRVKA
jgi:predicted nucleotidyltransferase